MDDNSRRKFLIGSAAVVGGLVTDSSIVSRAASGNELPDETPTELLAVGTVLNEKLVVRVQASAPAEVRLIVWRVANPTRRFYSPWTLTGRGNTAELESRTRVFASEWAWEIRIRKEDGSGPKTIGPTRNVPVLPYKNQRSVYKFGFGSCYRKKSPAPSLVAATDPSENLRFFSFLGDMGYPDVESNPKIDQTYDGYSAYFREMFTWESTELDRISNNMPLYAVQDDHDLGCDDSGRLTVEPFAIDAFADLMPGVPSTDPGLPKTAHRSWNTGKVEYFMVDNRRDSDELPANCKGIIPPPPQNGVYRSVLGEVQRSWLKDGLRDSTALMKVIFAPRTMTWYWHRNERDELLDWIRDEVSGKVLICSGDKHGSAFVKPREDLEVWEMLCGPINVPKKHKIQDRDGIIWRDELDANAEAMNNATGVVEVDTSQAPGSMNLRWVTDDGSNLFEATI